MGGSPENKSTQDENPWGRSRKRRVKEYRFPDKRRLLLTVCLVTAGLLILTAGIYVRLGLKYRQTFFPNTIINGLDASGKTVAEVEKAITDGMDGYVLTLEKRDGNTEQIDGAAISLHPEFDGTLPQILASQNFWKWAFHAIAGSEYTIETMIAYDEDKLKAVFAALECMEDSKTTAPRNACLSAYQENAGYQIIPEQEGTRLVKEIVWNEVTQAILNLQGTISLAGLDAYEKPEITSDNEQLKARSEEYNRYVNVTVIYHFGSRTERLDGNTIHTWLTEYDNGTVGLDDEAVAAYVKTLAEKYNTAYHAKSLQTSYGPTVTITAGNYGWRINQSAETAALTEIIRSGVGQTREPVYSQTAASHAVPDYGNTYVEINLTAQHLYYYKDGTLLVESDFVSGNEAKGWSTPAGAYPLTYKQRDATLKGEGYNTPVSYWMPFNGGIGLHDAGWRSSFGGTIYKTGGSHGCVNLPPAAAKTIFENITAGTPVLCYHLEGTQRSQASCQTAAAETTAAQSSSPAQATAAVETAAETAAETTAEAAAETTAEPETPAAETQALETGESAIFSQTPIMPAPTQAETETAAGSEAAAGPGGEKTRQDTGVVDAPGM